MIAIVLSAIVALLHLYFLVLEMFRWEEPRTRAAFGTSEEFARASRVLAANQGLYNGFLAVGILLSLYGGEAMRPALIFALTCVCVAGLYGARTASPKILYIQALPGAIALAAVLYRV